MKNRRTILNYSIKRKMQLRLLGNVMLVAAIATILAGVFFYFYSNQTIEQSFKQFHIQARSFLDFLFPAVMVALGIGIIIAFGIALFFPHKIAGPLYRMEREIKERVGEGDLSVRFSVRKGDELQELADALNSMVEKLGTKLKRVKTATEELSFRFGSLPSEGQSFKEISEAVKKLEEAVKEFKL